MNYIKVPALPKPGGQGLHKGHLGSHGMKKGFSLE